jgi:hypothetical protein
VTWELAEGLHEAGVAVEVLCANQGLVTVHERAAAGYRVSRAGSWGRLLATSVSSALVVQLLRRRLPYDEVPVHMPDPMAAAAIWHARRSARLVVHWHSDIVRQRRGLELYKPLQDWLMARADAVIATCDAYARASDALAPWLGKVTVVPIGLRDRRFPKPAQAARIAQLRGRWRHLVFALGRMPEVPRSPCAALGVGSRSVGARGWAPCWPCSRRAACGR